VKPRLEDLRRSAYAKLLVRSIAEIQSVLGNKTTVGLVGRSTLPLGLSLGREAAGGRGGREPTPGSIGEDLGSVASAMGYEHSEGSLGTHKGRMVVSGCPFATEILHVLPRDAANNFMCEACSQLALGFARGLNPGMRVTVERRLTRGDQACEFEIDEPVASPSDASPASPLEGSPGVPLPLQTLAVMLSSLASAMGRAPVVGLTGRAAHACGREDASGFRSDFAIDTSRASEAIHVVRWAHKILGLTCSVRKRGGGEMVVSTGLPWAAKGEVPGGTWTLLENVLNEYLQGFIEGSLSPAYELAPGAQEGRLVLKPSVKEVVT
jgi:hypothetical protein